MTKLNIRLTTKSNVLIGGAPVTFEIGGVDMYTVTDFNGNPYIPASTFKGMLRTIIRDMVEENDLFCKEISDAYQTYLNKLFQQTDQNTSTCNDETRLKNLKVTRDNALHKISAEYLFGIEGFNQTPKLIFTDLLMEKQEQQIYPFSIDSKNTIEVGDKNISSNPRTYQTIRPGITFSGEVLFYKIEQLNLNNLSAFLTNAIERFNTGCYRIGNSGSRGYGNVHVEIMEGK